MGSGVRGFGKASCAFAIFVVVLIGGGSLATAQDWSLSSSISQRVSYNTNLLLNPDRETSGFGFVTIPRLTLERATPTSTLTLDGQFKFAEYIDHSDLNSQDQLINFKGTKDLSERSTIALNADFDRDTTLQTESDTDITERFLDKAVHFTYWDVAPSWSYLLSPIDRMIVTGVYQSKDYSTNEKTDYQYYGPTLDYEHSISELAKITGNLSYFRYDPAGATNPSSDIYGGLIGYQYAPTERLSIGGSVGLSYTKIHGDNGGGTATNNQDDSTIGYRMKFNFDYTLTDQTTASLLLSHDTEPSGDGRQVTRNRATLNLGYEMNELTRFGFAASYADNQDYFGAGTSLKDSDGNSRYYLLRPSVSFDFTEDLSLTASYQFRYKTFGSENGSAIDNAAFLTLRYALPDVHWSGF
jgi:hypothetical protein